MADDKCIINPERDCIGLAAAAALEGRIKALEGWQEDSKKFHNAFYDWQRTQIAREARLDEQLKTMDENIRKVVAYQEGQRNKPAKRWDAIVDKAILMVLAAVGAVILAKVGL